MKNARLDDWLNKIGILVIPPELYVKISSEIPVEIIKDWNMQGVYVSANKPYSTVKDYLLEFGVLEKLVFVDCASKLAGDNPSGAGLVLIDNPADLTGLTININKNIKQFGDKKFLIFDSLTTLLIYTKLKQLTQFAHSLGLSLKASKVTTLFLAVDQEATKEMLRFLSTIADNFVHLTIDQEGDVVVA